MHKKPQEIEISQPDPVKETCLEQPEHEKLPASIMIRMVIFFGFFLQLIIAFFGFILIAYIDLFSFWGENLALTFELLLSFMSAVPLGFLLANFIVHRIPVLRIHLDEVSSYSETQSLLFKLLWITLCFVAFACFAIVGLQSIMR